MQPEIDSQVLSTQLRNEKRRLRDPFAGQLPFDLGSYQLLNCIGRGASGAVYRARHRSLERDVAVKVLATGSMVGSRVDLFLDEIRHVGKLNHPNIVRATDAGESHGFHFLVMEYSEGIDASQLRRMHGPLAIAEACEICRQIALGLQFAHDHGLVHRDVKPANILLTARGEVKLIDLGIATHCESQLSDSNAPRLAVGTATYMAPEQWARMANVSACTDIYGLGCTLLRLIAGQLPAVNFAADQTRESQLRHLISSQCGKVPRRLRQFMQRMVSDDPLHRPSSAAGVADTLGKWSRNADLPALVSTYCEETGQPTGSQSPAISKRAEEQWTRRAVITAGAGIALGSAGILLRGWDDSPRLEKKMWRSLSSREPRILFSLEDSKQITCRATTAGIAIDSKQLALVSLGRPVASEFTMRADLKQANWTGDLGLFFCGGQADSRGAASESSNTWSFQSIDLRPSTEDIQYDSHRLLWSEWRIAKQGGEYSVKREPWAEARVEIEAKSATQSLVVQLGRNGMPAVEWNGQDMHANRWRLSTEGRRRLSLSADRLQIAFLGQLGLLNLSGANAFLQPQLAYL
ncbi:serine/threonine-protein kinase [Adhaeretor mobilis]|nr:serine/threonine-protein kinase [Adhaeretor mobilis]